MKFSLILATLNRPTEIEHCLLSLVGQDEKDFEVIIIDQSDDELTRQVAERFDMLNLVYIHINIKGLSKARNKGIENARGEYICLIDDDAIYRNDYLMNASILLSRVSNTILSGEIFSIDDKTTQFVDYTRISRAEKLGVREIVNYCPSAALIIPRDLFLIGIKFNERLGVGNAFAACEETEVLLKAYDEGYIITHTDKLVLFHPIKPVTIDMMDSVYKHYMGKGALVKIDYMQNKRMRLSFLFMRNTIGMIIKAYILDSSRKTYYLVRKNGFVDGLRTYIV